MSEQTKKQTTRNSNSKTRAKAKTNNTKKPKRAKKSLKGSKSIKSTKSARSDATNNGVKDDIAAIILLALGIFIAISMHTNLAGEIGNGISNMLKGIFGLGGFFVPYALIVYSFIMFAKVARPFQTKTIVSIVVIVLMVDLINAERYLGSMKYGILGIVEVYKEGTKLKNGGVFGMYIGGIVEKLIGSTGLYIFSICMIVICILLIVNSPISVAIENSKKRRERRRKKKELQLKERQSIKNSKPQLREDKVDFMKIQQSESVPAMESSFDSNSQHNKKNSSILKYMEDDPNFGLTTNGRSKQLQNKFETEKNKLFAKKNQQIKDKNLIKDANLDGPQIHIPQENFIEPDVISSEVNKSNVKDKLKSANMTTDKDMSSDAASFSSILPKEKIKKVNIKVPDTTNKMAINYELPLYTLLNRPKKKSNMVSEDDLRESAIKLEETLKSFNVNARVVNVTRGSSITRYEIQPAVGVKVNSIVRLADDIALNLKARSIRMEAPIPGKAAVGIEVENAEREMVTAYELLASKEFREHESKLAFSVGRDISGKPIIADLGKMPHLLIAGATGSGKSVCINMIIASILYKAKPDEVKLVLVDPKMVELGNYNGIPHLLIPVVTDSSKAAAALNWAVAEMTTRYKKFAKKGVRDLKSYNKLMEKNDTPNEVMPKIVIIIDELADLMMVASSQVEDAICRLAQLARAAGMHLVVATQRPSVDVITGLIKANIPSRIAFMVSSQIDSRTIIDSPGAEKLVGNGDMLFKPQDLNKPLRIQGPFISDDEVRKLIEYVKNQGNGEVEYSKDVLNHIEKGNIASSDSDDELLEDAILQVINAGQASVSMVQRRFRVGYNRAARMVEAMEQRGIVSAQDGSKPRNVLITLEEYEHSKEEEDKEI